MLPIAVFYHLRISGGEHPANDHFEGNGAIDNAHALTVVDEQCNDLFTSRLMDAADYVTVGLNGTSQDYRQIRKRLGAVNIVQHGEAAASELPTLAYMHNWSRRNPKWTVCYFHGKGVSWPPSRPGWDMRRDWRRCMMNHLIYGWADCVQALEAYEMVGCHYGSKEKYPHLAKELSNPIWAGNFFWARSEYIAQLPEIPPEKQVWRHRYEAEMWPVSGKIPTSLDLAPHWPGDGHC